LIERESVLDNVDEGSELGAGNPWLVDWLFGGPGVDTLVNGEVNFP
jgi:hypothetical protein